MRKFQKHAYLLAGIFFISLSACEEKDPKIPNEEELITTVKYQLTPDNGGAMVEMSYVDLDGDGGDAPVVTGGVLAIGETYTGKLILLNELESPAENITEEVDEEAEEHQFFFVTDVTGLEITYTDQDANGNPVGLNSALSASTAGSGQLSIVLKHEPDKFATGVSAGDLQNAGGETDVEITFDVTVQ